MSASTKSLLNPFLKLEKFSSFFPGRREVDWSPGLQNCAYLIWMFFEHPLCLASDMGKLMGTHFNTSDCWRDQEPSKIHSDLAVYATDLTTMHLDCVIIQIAAMGRK